MNQPETVREWWQVEIPRHVGYFIPNQYARKQAALKAVQRMPEADRKYARIAHHVETKTIL